MASSAGPRVAARAVIVQRQRLLIVNAWPGAKSDLWCAPGGGAERGMSLPENLAREIHEETGLRIAVGVPCLVNEFHDPFADFHQVDIYFRARVTSGSLQESWTDPAGVVSRRRWVSEAELRALRFKPDSLPDIAFAPPGTAIRYDPLEPIQR